MYSRNRQIAQLWCLIHLLQAVCVKRVLAELAPSPKQDFWSYLQGLTTDKASIEFAKVFDSTTDDTHWTQSFDKSSQDEIRKSLFTAFKISSEEWDVYRQTILDYRNQLAAHHDLNARVANYPDFTIAEDAAYFMYQEIYSITHLHLDASIPDDLRDYIANYDLNIRSSIRQSFKNSAL